MPYYPDIGLELEDAWGTYPVVKGVREACRRLGKCTGATALDLGTGTGIFAIYLAKRGFAVTATDINRKALRLARRNSQKNKTSIRFIHSDLYAHVPGRFDLIVFNPPFFSIGTSSRIYGLLSYIYHKLVPARVDSLVTRWGSAPWLGGWARRARQEMVLRFLSETPQHLTPHGTVYVLLPKEDTRLLRQFPRVRILDSSTPPGLRDASCVFYQYL